jgi:hypothetical protein
MENCPGNHMDDESIMAQINAWQGPLDPKEVNAWAASVSPEFRPISRLSENQKFAIENLYETGQETYAGAIKKVANLQVCDLQPKYYLESQPALAYAEKIRMISTLDEQSRQNALDPLYPKIAVAHLPKTDNEPEITLHEAQGLIDLLGRVSA